MGMRGVMFDAGGVLVRPVGGRWNPRYDFEGIVREHHPGVDEALFASAILVGQRFLDDAPNTASRADYHRAMLAVLGVAAPSAELLHRLEAPAAGPALEPYPDVRRTLDRLEQAAVRMSVVSDAWPELVDLFAALDLDRYFRGFAISAVLGCNKPDPRMYAEGRRLLDLPPGECLFIDDDPLLVAAARDLGYQGLTLDRYAAVPQDGVITTLDQMP
jgi:HAD superfamily hydrolase (TIGR01509 family)